MKYVLVVDDEPIIREVVAEVLREGGYAVDTADDGAQALQKVQQAQPDAVILDLMMPVMDGWTFVARCRSDPRWDTIPILIMSAARDATVACRTLGADRCVPKPFDIDDLLTAVDQITTPHSLARG